MKKLYLWTTMVLATMALVATSCKTPEEETKPTPEEPTELTFEADVDDVTTSTVTYSVTPSDQSADYIVVLAPETVIDANGVGDKLITTIMENLRANASSSGQTFNEYMSKVTSRGSLAQQQMTGLVQDTDYALIIFGLDAEANYAATTEATIVPFTTEAIPMSDCTFEVTPTVSANEASIEVIPSDKNINWHMFIVNPAMYEAYTDPEGDYKMSEMDFFAAYMYDEIQQYLGAGYDMPTIIAGMMPTGDQIMRAQNLTANTTYGYMIAAVAIDGDNFYVVSEPQYDTFTTPEAALSEMTFDIEVDNVEQLRVDLKITPSNLDEKFTWAVGVYDGTSTDEELMNAWINMNKAWLDMGFMLYNGVQDYTAATGAYKYKVELPDTDYYVLAVGYNGGITTAPAVAKFRTLPAGAPEDTTFEVSADVVTGYGFTVTVKPSEVTTNYFFGSCPAGTFNQEQTVAEITAMLEEAVLMNQMFNPNTTIADILPSYAWKGEYQIDSDACEPNTAYDVFILAMNTDGTLAKAHLFNNFVTTKAIGSVKPTIEVSCYSGDEENGAVFGDPEATKGKAIVVVKLGNLDNATAVYYNFGYDSALMNPESRPDNDIYMSSYWYDLRVSQPYVFSPMDWAYEIYVLAHALDANGLPGEISRLAYTPTAEEKGDINDLIELVNTLNSAAQAPCKVLSPMKENVAPVEVGTVLNKQNTTSTFVGTKSVEPTIPETIARPEMEQPKLKIGLRTLNHVSYIRTK